MARENFNDLLAFLSVAREKSFTRAAAKLGVSQSALSHTIRALEARMGVRLLTRTTRSVATTDAGERLFRIVSPRFEEIEAELTALAELREKPAGTVRITSTDYAIRSLLWPKLKTFLPQYPDIKVELINEYGMTDIVAQRFDAGVRLGEEVANGMVAVRIGPDVRFAVVGTRDYFARHPAPRSPQELTSHTCINLRLPTYGGLYAWEFEKDGRELSVHVEGQVIFNDIYQVLDATVAGFGLSYLPEDLVEPYITSGHFERVLEGWCPYWTGYHIYYPNRRQSSRAMTLLIEALRHRA